MMFDSETNKLAWKFKKQFDLEWKAAFRMAVFAMQHPYSFYGTWRPESTSAVAGHFWGLGKAYAEIGDTGRSIAMTKVAKSLYGMAAMMQPVSLDSLKQEKFFGDSVLQEAEEFFVASALGGLTQRTCTVIYKLGAKEYGANVKPSSWHF